MHEEKPEEEYLLRNLIANNPNIVSDGSTDLFLVRMEQPTAIARNGADLGTISKKHIRYADGPGFENSLILPNRIGYY